MSRVALLDRECQLERTGDGVFERDCGRIWWGHEAQFGGYAMSLAMTAARLELAKALGADQVGTHGAGTGHAGPAPMYLHMCSMQFLRPFQEGAFRAEVTLERTGRTMANLTARLWSAGKLAGLALVAFGRPRAVAEFSTAAMPDVAPLHDDEVPVHTGFDIPTHGLFDLFPRIGRPLEKLPPDQLAVVGGWVRPHTPEIIDERYAVCLADLWPPAAYHVWTKGVTAQSVDITAHVRTPMPHAGLAPGTALFVQLTTRESRNGFVDEDCEIWSPGGILLFESRQARYVHG
jgi:acyl-coenzyme A thioesterase PaaI-like protein